jgi:hypothetical protein
MRSTCPENPVHLDLMTKIIHDDEQNLRGSRLCNRMLLGTIWGGTNKIEFIRYIYYYYHDYT